MSARYEPDDTAISAVVAKVARLADEHGVPNGFTASECTPFDMHPMRCGQILRSEHFANALRHKHSLKVVPRRAGGYAIMRIA